MSFWKKIKRKIQYKVPKTASTHPYICTWEKKYEVNGNVLQLKPDMIREYGIQEEKGKKQEVRSKAGQKSY